MPQPRVVPTEVIPKEVIPTEVIKPKDEIVQEIIQRAPFIDWTKSQ